MLEKWGIDFDAPYVAIGDFSSSLVARAPFTNVPSILVSIGIGYLVTRAAVLLFHRFSSGRRSVLYAPSPNYYINSSVVACGKLVFIKVDILYAEARAIRINSLY